MLLYGLFTNTTVIAQMRFGITGGGALSSASVITNVKYNAGGYVDFLTYRKSIISYHAGITITYPLSRTLNVKGDLLLSQKGWVNDYKTKLQTGQYTFRFVTGDERKFTLSYIELPVLLLYNVPAGPGKGFIGGGGYLGYALKIKDKKLGGDGSYPNVLRESANLDTNHHKIDYGFAVSIGYEYGFGLFFNLGVQYGLKEMYERDDVGALARGYKTMHRQLRFGIGYMFNRKRKAR